MELQQLEKDRSANEILECLNKKNYDANDKDKFELEDCVICMEVFKAGEAIMEIPTCKHFFHQECCKRWFHSVNQEEQKRCPLCNDILTKDKLRDAKK